MNGTSLKTTWAFPLAFMAALVVLAGCGDRVERGSQHLERIDSGGVAVVDVPPPTSVMAAPIRVDRVARLDYEFGAVRTAALLDDGGLVVADALSDEVLLFDERGRFERAIGGPGQGPGEFREPTSLQVQSGGLIVVYDRYLRRVTHFQEGSLVATHGLGPESRVLDLRPLVYLGDETYLVTHGEDRRGFRSSTEPIWRDSIPLMIMRSEGSIDTLGLWAGTEKAFQESPAGIARLTVGFGAEALVSASGSFVAIGSSDPLNVTVFEGGEERLHLISRAEAAPPTTDDLSALREWRVTNIRIDQDWYEPLWMDAPVRETIPLFGAIAVSASGQVWLGDYVKPGERERTWIVVNLDGQAVGRVDLPAEWSIFDVRNERMVVHWEGEYDEDYLEIREFELPEID